MQPDEVRALGDIGGEAVAGVAIQVREMHEGIARRVFHSVGIGAVPVKIAHDRIADRLYSSATTGLGTLVRAGAALAGARRPEDAPSIHASITGRLAVGALNGAFGDALVKRGNALALPMTVRRDGRDVGST